MFEMSFSSDFSVNDDQDNNDNVNFFQAKDVISETRDDKIDPPIFNSKAFFKVCMNNAKTAKISGNDANCTANVKKL